MLGVRYLCMCMKRFFIIMIDDSELGSINLKRNKRFIYRLK